MKPTLREVLLSDNAQQIARLVSSRRSGAGSCTRLLCLCIVRGAFSCADSLLGMGVCDADRTYSEGTPLTMACSCGETPRNFLLRLIASASDVNVRDAQGRPLLLVVVSNASMDFRVVEELLRRGASPNAESTNGESALSFAVVWEDLELLDLLLRYGADVNCPSGGNTPLMDALSCGRRLDVAKRLVAAGADIRARSNGRSVLEASLASGTEEQCVYVIENGGVTSNSDTNGNLFALVARQRGFLQAERLLRAMHSGDIDI